MLWDRKYWRREKTLLRLSFTVTGLQSMQLLLAELALTAQGVNTGKLIGSASTHGYGFMILAGYHH